MKHRSSIDDHAFQRGDAVIVRDSRGNQVVSGTIVRAGANTVAVKYIDRNGRWQTTSYYARYVEAE
jgi:hypothetical protein